jgi:probable selenium-dependent hydroxylase accessory protein YqeC
LYRALGLEKSGVVSIVGAGGKTSLMFGLAHEISGSGQTVLTTTTTKIMMPRKDQSCHVILTPSIQSLLDHARLLLKENLHICAASPGLPEYPEKIVGFQKSFIDAVGQSGLFDWIIVEADGAAQKSLKVPAEHEPVIPLSSTYVIGVVGLNAIGKPLHPEWVFRHKRYASITGLSEGLPVTLDSVVRATVHPEGIFKGSPPHAQKILFLNTAGNPHQLKNGRKLGETLLKAGVNHDIRRLVIGCPLEKETVIEGLDLI